MTMKPRAVKFRLRRSQSAAPAAQPQDDEVPLQPEGAPEAAPAQVPQDVAEDAGSDVEKQRAAIRAEGLTGRQLRTARRVANSHGIDTEDEYEAVRLLRERGIDPFKHTNVLEVVSGGEKAKETPVQLPQTVPQPGAKLPAPNVMGEAQRAREIIRIQQDIARRRRRKMIGLFVRLAIFVFLPTLVTGYYFAVIATPMYGTKSEFLIQQASPANPGGNSGGGGIFGGGLALSQDSVTVQSYLESREAMLRLDADHGFKAHFSNPAIDPIQRLSPDASNEEAYETYQRNVLIGYDPTEGIIKMEVIATDPEVSAEFSRALISYAEEQVDQLTQRLRDNQMVGARESYDEAEANMREAQKHVVDLQEQLGVLSADAEVSSLMSQISTFEVELTKEQLALQELLDNSRPNQSRVEVARRNIARLEEVIANLRAQMTTSNSDSSSLARISGELVIAQADLETRQALFRRSLEQLEAARIEANRQVRLITTGVSPVPPDEPTYPRVFENTVVAFLAFAGLYLMFSLTAAILREQVAA